MANNVGSQTVDMKFHAERTSANINSRFKDIRPVGIYKGGYLAVADTTHATLTPLTCEISDGTYQVRVSTASNVTLTVSAATPYIILRWTYSGSETADYMQILAVAYSSTTANDIIVGKCTFSSGNLIGFSYTNGIADFDNEQWLNYRNYALNSNNQLKVIPSTPLIGGDIIVLPGRIQTANGTYDVPLQTISLTTVSDPSMDRIDLVYFNTDTQSIDVYEGSEAPPVLIEVPDYAGKLVLAEIIKGNFTITASQIRDVRSFITQAAHGVDGTTIEADTTGNLKVVDPVYFLSRSTGSKHSNVSTWTTVTDLGSQFQKSGIIASYSTGIMTLPANKLYRLSYTVWFKATSGSPIVGARILTTSGDLNWEFKNDILNVSQQYTKTSTNATSLPSDTLSGTYIIYPSSTTNICLQVITADGTGAYGAVTGHSFTIWG